MKIFSLICQVDEQKLLNSESASRYASFNHLDLVVKQRRGKQTKRAVYKQWEVSESSKQGKMLDPPNRPEMFEGVIGDLPDICTCI